MKPIIVYYSYEGNTEFIASVIAELLRAQAVRISPIKEMTSSGFGKYVWGGGQVVMKIKPKLQPFTINFDDFDTVFLGSPIWAGTFAPPIKTLLEDGYFHGKNVFYFYTHEGGAQNAHRRIEAALSKTNRLVSSEGFLDVLKNPEENRQKAQAWVAHCLKESE